MPDDEEPSGSDARESNGQESPSSPPDSFEFFSAATEMCSAEDVFLGGRLLPFRSRPPPPPPPPRNPPGSIANRGMRREASDPDKPPAMKPQQRRWYFFVVGPMRVPAAMEMEDIRSRQTRRRSQPPTGEAGDRVGCLSKGRRGPWRLLRSLSCNGGDSVATPRENHVNPGLDRV